MNTHSLLESYSVMMDPEVRQMLRKDPAAAVRELESRGYPLFNPDNYGEIKVVTSTESTAYIPLSQIEDVQTLSSQDLERITAAGASTTSSAASAGSLSSFGCATTCVSTVACASTAGTVGSAG